MTPTLPAPRLTATTTIQRCHAGAGFRAPCSSSASRALMFATDGVTWAPGDVGAEPRVVLNGVRRCVWSVPLLERSLERERLRERPLEQSLPGWSMLRSDHEKRQRQRRRRRLRQQQQQRQRRAL